ncbi:hypothetical protein BDY21DRAFT_282100 [Lineolata rhizophorae]|uniref:ABM domain-containing protein n=1 Tax=Lineolata rhizophorae TaxID=578093 RepID=A0A6A6P6S1_9PEZI|nr:hypothetical protein BDY21DRAFT_282100 [Lineolata rhizophorae]
MLETVEIAYVTPAPGANFADAESDAGKALALVNETSSKQPGCKANYYGQQVEHPELLQLGIVWTSVDAHKAFTESPDYGAFLASVQPVVAGPDAIRLFHVELATPFSTAASAPVVEFLTCYFPPSYSNAQFDAVWDSFASELMTTADGAKGTVGGWVVEELEHKSLEAHGGKGKAFVAAIGWESVEKHMAYRDTDKFKEIIQPFRKEVSGIEMHHVELKLWQG